jgi:MoaA/NifB/PqqE/SkfB family radical SAM enzyme
MPMAVAADRLDFVWLELTGQCQLRCAHCYASSGPGGDRGTMSTADWRRVIDQAAELGLRRVQLVGGEPTLHPDLPELVRHALQRGLEVEVYTNLVRVTAALWQVYSLPGVRLATSYYSTSAVEHDAITGRRGSHGRTLANIREARHRGIPLRAGVVQISHDQDVAGAIAELNHLGIDRVRVDRMRQVGRGVRDQKPGIDQLCGSCAGASLAVLPSGEALPCVFARWIVYGNVRDDSLALIHRRAAPTRHELAAAFATRPQTDKDKPADHCPPKDVGPPCPPNFQKEPEKCPPKDGGGPE